MDTNVTLSFSVHFYQYWPPETEQTRPQALLSWILTCLYGPWKVSFLKRQERGTVATRACLLGPRADRETPSLTPDSMQ